MANHPTSRNTKNEILAMYAALLKEKEQLEIKVRQLQQEKQSAPLERKMPEKKAAAVPSTLEGTIETLSALRPGFGDAVSELSAQLIAETTTLQELRNSVDAEIRQLETLHDLKVHDDMLEQLIRQYTEKSAEFEEQDTQLRESFEREMAEKKLAWQKEQAEHARFIKERDEMLKKKEKREATEYRYALELQRKLELDTYEQEREQQEKSLKNFEAGKKTEWAEKEKNITEQEAEFRTMQAQVEKFPKELDAAIKKAREEGAKVAREQAKVKVDLRTKEAEGVRRVFELEIESLEDIIHKQREQLKTVSAQLDAAAKQAQTLAMKAIEGSSSAGSLKAVREIALEQAKNVQKVK
jgi:hypothetical protein